MFYAFAALLSELIAGPSGAVVLVVVALFLVSAQMFAAVKRIHDFNTSAWWLILLWIPVLNIIMGLVLLFRPGTDGYNRFDGPGEQFEVQEEPSWSSCPTKGTSDESLEEGLRRLKALFDRGLLTAEAYADGQAKLLTAVTGDNTK